MSIAGALLSHLVGRVRNIYSLLNYLLLFIIFIKHLLSKRQIVFSSLIRVTIFQ